MPWPNDMVQPCPCFSRFQLCGFAQRPWAQFCEFGCGTCLVKDISVSEGKPNQFAVHQLETYTAPLGIHRPQSGKNNIALAFWLTFEQWKGIKFTDVFGYIYTSGTTGLPKAPRSGVLTTSKVSILSIFWGFLREKSTVRPNAFFSNAFTFMCWHGFTNSNGKVYSEST